MTRARSRRLAALGVLLVLIAGVLGAVALSAGRDDASPAGARAAATAGCRAFDEVYEATRPGAPIDADRLSRRLEQAIDSTRRAASEDAEWDGLARRMAAVGDAVNDGDAIRAAQEMGDAHRECEPLLESTRRT